MSSHEITCPSGMIVTVRELRVRDEDLLADTKSLKSGSATTDLLNAITVGLVDSGPYEFNPPDKIDWKAALQGDRLAVLLKIRIETFGSDFDVRTKCGRCGSKVHMGYDLNHLKLQELPKDSHEHARDPHSHIRTTLPKCGKKVEFKLLRGSDDAGMAKLQKHNKDSMSSSYFKYRLKAVEGLQEHEWKGWLEDMSAQDASFLRSEFDRCDCGIDQSIELECENCEHYWEEDLRLGADFLFPKYRRKTTTTG